MATLVSLNNYYDLNLFIQLLKESICSKRLVYREKQSEFENIVKYIHRFGLCFDGNKCGHLTLLEQFLGSRLLKYRCIIHQEALYEKTLNLYHVMNIVLRCVSIIQNTTLNTRDIRQFLSNTNEIYHELLIHCEVRCLSKGKILYRICTLKPASISS
ncbi:hypothetical protein RF11_15935 [Thelohanellus kitauei]|uniref:Uncharacterized protein n=1 Tax=Thelohanellus kitauei TaxID=669202 RepID=A0A0C2MH36_THEKT|nr:hypothetical protein RF11_15935 [Thelohanellus kitauei]